MRTFIAISLPAHIKERLASLQNQLKATGADIKWVEPQNIHLTLKFLGEIDDEKLEKTSSILENVAKDKNSFQIRIYSLGAFPKIISPRVIWVGIDKGDRQTQEIAKALEEKIVKIGIPKEDRAFSSHITIGRTRSGLNREGLVKEMNYLADSFGKENLEFSVNKISLFKSTLTPKGPLYEVLKEAILSAT
jgi:2'-5' RNA ligase